MRWGFESLTPFTASQTMKPGEAMSNDDKTTVSAPIQARAMEAPAPVFVASGSDGRSRSPRYRPAEIAAVATARESTGFWIAEGAGYCDIRGKKRRTRCPTVRDQMQVGSPKHALPSRLLVLGGALAGAGLLLYVGRDLWFFGDEWAFLLHRSLSSFADLFRPHNEHWSSVPIVIYRIVFSGASITSYTPYFLILVLLNLATGYVVGAHLLKLGAPVLVAALVAGGLVAFGPGGENLLWSFQIGFAISVLAAVLSFLQVERHAPTSDVRAAVLLILSLASSGIGVPAVGAVALYLLLRRQWRRFLLVAGPPIVVYSLWLGLAGSAAAESVSANLVETLLLLPTFTARGLTATVDGLFGLQIGLGLLALVLLGLAVASFLGNRPKRAVAVVALSMMMAVLVFAGAGLREPLLLA